MPLSGLPDLPTNLTPRPILSIENNISAILLHRFPISSFLFHNLKFDSMSISFFNASVGRKSAANYELEDIQTSASL